MCDGQNDLPSISRHLTEKTKQPPNEEIVKLTINQLRELDLMSEKTPKYFSKTSRRKAMKQIGLATMAVLLAVFALTAPTAANASSSGACFQIGTCYAGPRLSCPPGCSTPQNVNLFYGANCNPADFQYNLLINCPGAMGEIPSGFSFKRTS